MQLYIESLLIFKLLITSNFTLYYHVQLFPETYKAFQKEYQSQQLEFLYVEGTSLGSSQLQSQKILNSDDLSQTLFVTVFTWRVSSRLRYTAWKEPVFGVFLVRISPHWDQKNSEYGHFSGSGSPNSWGAVILSVEDSWTLF